MVSEIAHPHIDKEREREREREREERERERERERGERGKDIGNVNFKNMIQKRQVETTCIITQGEGNQTVHISKSNKTYPLCYKLLKLIFSYLFIYL